MKVKRLVTDGPVWLNTEGAAAFLGVSVGWIKQRRSAEGKLRIPHYRTGRLIRYRRDELENWLKQCAA